MTLLAQIWAWSDFRTILAGVKSDGSGDAFLEIKGVGYDWVNIGNASRLSMAGRVWIVRESGLSP